MSYVEIGRMKGGEAFEGGKPAGTRRLRTGWVPRARRCSADCSPRMRVCAAAICWPGRFGDFQIGRPGAGPLDVANDVALTDEPLPSTRRENVETCPSQATSDIFFFSLHRNRLRKTARPRTIGRSGLTCHFRAPSKPANGPPGSSHRPRVDFFTEWNTGDTLDFRNKIQARTDR